ncbi:MAG TPA: cytochrome c peroxidase [Kofleriaceae bacterium]
MTASTARVVASLCCALAACTAKTQSESGSAAGSGSAAVEAEKPKLVAFEPPKSTLDMNLVELGKLLFFDTRLSGENTMSCATCHEPKTGWTDGLVTASGLGGKQLARNTPTVINIDYRLPLFWDGRAKTAEEQAMMPIANPEEMAQDVEHLITSELAVVPEYAARFRRLFPKEGVTKDTVTKALAAFERSLISHDAPLDRYLKGDHSAMTTDAIAGMALFIGKAECIKCHEGTQLTDNSFHNIGVRGTDAGRFAIVDLPAMKGAFKTPGLRDIALTAPYFHDGSEATLEEVVDHYNRGGDTKENLDRDIRPLALTPVEQRALVAFMHALTSTRPVIVEPPALPGSYVRKRAKLTTFMKQAEQMLDIIDSLIASINERNWPEMDRRCMNLVQLAEELDVSRGAKVKREQWPLFREKQGDLVVAIKDLRAVIGDRSVVHTHEAYKRVRASCDGCHDALRADTDATGKPGKGPAKEARP